MKLCRFESQNRDVHIGCATDANKILDLTSAGVSTLSDFLEKDDPVRALKKLEERNVPQVALHDIRLLPPVDQQEVWAVGVTYLRSKKARMEESDFSASAYDRVYDAARPELFFKALPEKVVAPGEAVGIRKDARWNVPGPELALVINSRGMVGGYAIGNDMS